MQALTKPLRAENDKPMLILLHHGFGVDFATYFCMDAPVKAHFRPARA